jgi:hypothetical protein
MCYDVLLGIYITAIEKRIKEITDNTFEYSRNGHKEKALEILRSGLKEYPNSYRIMSAIVLNLWNGNYIVMNESEEVRNEVIHFSEKILAECTDDDGNRPYTKEECIILFSKIIEI